MNDKPSIGIGHYAVVVRRQWKTIVATILLCTLTVLLYLVIAPTRVTASTLVNVNVIVSDPFNPSRPASGLLDAATEDELASSYVVAKAAATALKGRDDAAALRDGVKVTTGSNATTVRVSYTAASVDRARAGADAMATSYLAYRQSQADARKTNMINQLQEQLTALGASLAKASTADKSITTTRMANVEFQINQLTAIDTTGGAVITPAAENPVSYSPQPATWVGGAVLAGLVLGLVVAFCANALGRRVRDAYDVEHASPWPVLADLRGAIAGIPPRGQELNDFRAIRERLRAAQDTPLGVLAVVDSTHGESDSDVAPCLASVFAQAGNDVELLIPGSSDDYLTRLREGLSLVPVDDVRAAHGTLFTSSRIPRLSVFRPHAVDPEGGSDECITEAVRQRATSKTDGTLTVLALPAGISVASQLAAGRLADAALIVAERARTTFKELSVSSEQMVNAGVPLVGVVLVRRGRSLGEAPKELARTGVHRRLEAESVTS